VRLSGRDYHYLVRVRRLAPGEVFSVLLPGGIEARVRIQSVDGGVLTGVCEAEEGGRPGCPLPGSDPLSGCPLPPIVLFQALPKGSKMDLIVRQAAEGGLAEVVPFACEYSVPRDGAGEEKIRRWERIIREARQQSGSRVATVLHRPLSMDGLFAYWEELKSRSPRDALICGNGAPAGGNGNGAKQSLGLFFHQSPLAEAGLHDYLESNPEIIAFAVGPEGGFSSAEAALFQAAGFKALTIGETVLRTETAALYGAAAIRTILLERALWMRSGNE
jgi:16S rRNA (uracil1498-N3)-methyltransferase